ncbi:MAG TPA: aminoacyl--tRNA ligase-related protein [Candidatus Paceibacterota bacterium]|nr:aminoacyl--tRNA ligase-related protein [Candidatus Paceibacterota bacterium]
MRQSQLFTRIERNAPKDEATVNAQLLVRAGFVSKLMAGDYSYLPLGLRVLNKIENIVREEMNAVGGEEIKMPQLHPKANWVTTGGWDKVDVLFKLKSRTDKEYALGQSEEEVVTPLVMKYVNTYKDLPKAVYQIHWKFRDELRSKSGLLRGVEFLMKDMYSFHADQKDFDRFYEVVKKAYLKIFARLGLVAKVTEASGGAFSEKISYEFMVLTDAGEDDILYCDACEFCVNVEIAKQKEGDKCPKCGKGKLAKARASEVGNVFDLGQRFVKAFDMGFMNEKGEKQYPIMGCFGLGISRVMGVIVEKCNDKNGILWPESVAPFRVHLLALNGVDGAGVYNDLQKAGIEVLYDDRDVTPGVKFAEADLIGIPWRAVVSPKTGADVEIKARSGNDAVTMSVKEFIKKLSSN